MPGTAAKIVVSERQQSLLKEFSKSRTVGKGIVQRATIVLLGFAGLPNEEIALQVGLNRQQVGLWRQRWRDAWDSLCVWECTEPHRLREAILDLLSDAPRPGVPATFTAEQVTQIVALACEPPKLSGRPIDHWTLRELRDEAITRKIVEEISVSQVGRFLQQAAVQPHRKKMWLNTTEKDPKKFQAEVENVCRTYLDAPGKAAVDGTHTVSMDEATSLQALERNAPDKPAQPDSVPKQEFEYTRHGTTTLTAGLDVVNGKIVCPTLGPTRTEADFVGHVARVVDTDPDAEWIFVVDCLNTHMSESLVKFTAARCGWSVELGKKRSVASSNRWPRARSSSRISPIGSASSICRNTARGSTRSRSSSGSSIESSCGAGTSRRLPTWRSNCGNSWTTTTTRWPTRSLGPTRESRCRRSAARASWLRIGASSWAKCKGWRTRDPHEMLFETCGTRDALYIRRAADDWSRGVCSGCYRRHHSR